VKDIQGRLLEDIDQYNCLYAITEICTADPTSRQHRSTFNLEGNNTWADLGGWIKHPTDGLLNGSVKTHGNAVNTYSCELSFNLLSAVFGGACDKYIPMSVMEGMQIELQLDNCANVVKYQFEAFPGVGGYSANANSNTLNGNTFAAAGARGYYGSHSTRSNVGVSDQQAGYYQPNIDWSDETRAFELNAVTAAQISYQIKNPVLYLSVLDVEPSVNAELIRAAKDRSDGMVRIQTFSWLTFSTQVQPNTTGLFQWTIPVSVTSMKSIFFTITPTVNYNNMNRLKTGFMHRGLVRYRVLIGGFPLNADWVTVKEEGVGITDQTYGEAITTLMEAWSVHQKTEGNATLLRRDNYAPLMWGQPYNLYSYERNAVFGQELESFSQKSGIIQSGINTMQTTFVLELDFGGQGSQTQTIQVSPNYYDVQGLFRAADEEDVDTYNAANIFEVRAYCMFDKVIAFDETSGSIRSEY